MENCVSTLLPRLEIPAGLKNSASAPLTVALFAPFKAIPLAPVGINSSVPPAVPTDLPVPAKAQVIISNMVSNLFLVVI